MHRKWDDPNKFCDCGFDHFAEKIPMDDEERYGSRVSNVQIVEVGTRPKGERRDGPMIHDPTTNRVFIGGPEDPHAWLLEKIPPHLLGMKVHPTEDPHEDYPHLNYGMIDNDKAHWYFPFPEQEEVNAALGVTPMYDDDQGWDFGATEDMPEEPSEDEKRYHGVEFSNDEVGLPTIDA